MPAPLTSLLNSEGMAIPMQQFPIPLYAQVFPGPPPPNANTNGFWPVPPVGGFPLPMGHPLQHQPKVYDVRELEKSMQAMRMAAGSTEKGEAEPRSSNDVALPGEPTKRPSAWQSRPKTAPERQTPKPSSGSGHQEGQRANVKSPNKRPKTPQKEIAPAAKDRDREASSKSGEASPKDSENSLSDQGILLRSAIYDSQLCRRGR